MSLHDAQCLALYECGQPRHAIDRALLLASSSADAGPSGEADWADVPLGVRDARLLALRCAWFGPRFDAVLACPSCAHLLTLGLDLRQFMAEPPPPSGPVVVAGRRYRCPTSRDLAAIVGAGDVDHAAAQLLAQLALDGGPQAGWQAADIATIESALDAADPLAHLALSVTCEQCEHTWSAPLDIGACLWDELAAQAREVVEQVHLLAGAYGWSERDILGMPAPRRRLYLQRVLT